MRQRFRLITRLGLIAAGLALSSVAIAASSGRYGPLALAVVDGSVHGVFAEGRLGNSDRESPQFSCLFLFEGRLERGTAKVSSWFPGEAQGIGGTLRLGEEAALQLDENHGGCLMTSGDMKAAPYVLSLDEPRSDWIGAGLVIAKRAVLRGQPDGRSRQSRPYLVEFDAVAVLERRPGWVRAEYLGAEHGAVRGWLRDSEVAVSSAAISRDHRAEL